MEAQQQSQQGKRRIVDTTLIEDWDGSGDKAQETPDNASISQHQICVWCDAVPTAGILQIRGRPRRRGGKASGAVKINSQLDAISLTAAFENGSFTYCFSGFFEAYEFEFTTALAGATKVSIYLSSAENFL